MLSLDFDMTQYIFKRLNLLMKFKMYFAMYEYYQTLAIDVLLFVPVFVISLP